MILLDKKEYPELASRYLSQEHFFPLIAAVLLNEQDGVVYGDRAKEPRQIYVQHAFGFSQLFGESVRHFELDLEKYLFVDRTFQVIKVRLYVPQPNFLLTHNQIEASWSERQRFIFGKVFGIVPVEDYGEHKFSNVLRSDIPEIQDVFGVVSQFWRSPDDFLYKSYAVIARSSGKLSGICYAAAVASGHAEIDVVTLPDYRRQGIGKALVTHFINACSKDRIKPLWDCFTNNRGSMELSRTSGFVALRSPYPFLTINR